MLIFLQYTLTDLRALTKDSPKLLKKPLWPSPTPFKEFVRGTGQVVQRKKLGLNSWVGEHYICRIGANIQFDPSMKIYAGKRVTPVFKHLYSSEYHIMTKYEFAFRLDYESLGYYLDYNDLRDIIDTILYARIRVKVRGKYSEIQANRLAEILPGLHYDATTAHQWKDKNHSSPIYCCTPQLFIGVEDEQMLFGLDANFNRLSAPDDGFALYGNWQNHRNNPVRAWIQDNYRNDTGHPFNRELRMTLMRLHSEYECLKNLFNAIGLGEIEIAPGSLESDRLQDYLNKAILTFLRAESDVSRNSGNINFLDYFAKIFSKAQPGELNHIIEKINSYQFRPAVEQKTVNFITNNNIEYMKNKFQNSGIQFNVQGDHNTISENTVNQTNYILPPDTDYQALASQLKALMVDGAAEAKTEEDFMGLAAIAKAEQAAGKKDGNGLLNALKAGGKFVGDVATKFSASLIVELMKAHHLLIG